jgi:hypothetical protein
MYSLSSKTPDENDGTPSEFTDVMDRYPGCARKARDRWALRWNAVGGLGRHNALRCVDDVRQQSSNSPPGFRFRRERQRPSEWNAGLPREGLNLKAQGREPCERTLGQRPQRVILPHRGYIAFRSAFFNGVQEQKKMQFRWNRRKAKLTKSQTAGVRPCVLFSMRRSKEGTGPIPWKRCKRIDPNN